MTYHLISHHLCPYVQRAVIVLSEKGIAHERTYIDLADKPGWFREVSPLGKVPVLQAGGVALFESQVIAEYLDEVTEGALLPEDALERARQRAWCAYASETLNAIAAFYSAPAEQFEEKRARLAEMFARVAPEVEGPFFAGARFGMVDAAWGPVFRYLDVFDALGDFRLLDGLPGVAAWRERLAARATVAQAVPEEYPALLRRFLCRRPSELGRRARAVEMA